MDCKRFDSLLEDLQRDMAMPANSRGEALQHADGCAYCRARLAAARLLSLELQALAKEDEKLQAPAHVDASLLAAFRDNGTRYSQIWRKLSWAGATAAVAFGGWLLAARPWQHPVSTPREKIQAARPAEVPNAASATSDLRRQNETAVKRGPREHSRPARSRRAVETANDFMALAGSSYPLGDGMVVRVELPRSAPALVGLPIPGGDLSGTVTADVVLGQDGVARAIRFVQPEEGKAVNQNFDFKQD